MSIEIFEGDNRHILRDLIDQGTRVHSAVMDPPYNFTSIVKRFGKADSKPAKQGSGGRFSRLSTGFQGQQWDATGIERDPEFWRLVYDILLPGGYCFAFSSAMTGHWQAVAMEQAGFTMHPFIAWLYSTGMPKAHAVTKFAPSAEEWDGWYYSTAVQKPAIEPIYVAQKPFSEKTGYANVLRHGVGAVNIGGCRVPSSNGDAGRWPANVIHDGSTGVVEIFPPGHDEFFHCFPVALHAPKANKGDRAGSTHPTVKPVNLMRHLVRLTTPRGGLVLDPFAGSGTTGEAAVLEGSNAILIEQNAIYSSDIRRRFNKTALIDEYLAAISPPHG